ncbi:MAG: DegV family protein [Ruminococcaceae bacterium]|nr:DegV family protein [Oscillospiraceae bacterium]
MFEVYHIGGKTLSKIIISSDSCCDIGRELAEKRDVKILPLIVTMGEDSFIDGVTAEPADIYKFVSETGILPKTAARSVADFEEYFKELTADGSEVVHISLSNCLSSTIDHAIIAAENIPGVHIVDSLNLSTGIGLLVLMAADLRDEGRSAEEIVNVLNATVPNVSASFVVERLDYLYKGGRCSAVSALGANLLKLRPCIEVNEGKMGVGKKYRGSMKNVLANYISDLLNQPELKVSGKRVFITHTAMSDDLDKYCEELVKETGLFDEVINTTAGGTVTSHCGPNTLGVLFIKE